MESIKIHKYLADCGIASRRKSEELVKQGLVTINGKTAKIGDRITPGKDQVLFKGKQVQLAKNKYYLLHKPYGYVSTVSDPQGRKTVLDLVPDKTRLYPVGRLDYNSEGLMLLTNDGDLAYRYTHPKFQVKKTYHVLVNGKPEQKDLNKLRRGMFLEDGKTAPAEVDLLEHVDGRTWIGITVHEGRKRQIRRMMERIQSPVVRLIRTRMGKLELGDLKPGEWKEITQEEALRGIASTS